MLKSGCAVKFCRNNGRNVKGISLHRFPTDPELRQEWIEVVRWTPDWVPGTNCGVCSIHFNKSDYMMSTNGRRRLLLKDAVPTRYMYEDETQNTVRKVIRKSIPKQSSDVLNKIMDIQACRLCLSSKVTLRNLQESGLVQTIADLTDIEVTKFDGLPQYVCAICTALLIKYAAFRARCHRAHDLLDEARGRNPITIKAIRSINRKKNQLTLPLKIKKQRIIDLKEVIIDQERLDCTIPEDNSLDIQTLTKKLINEINDLQTNEISNDNNEVKLININFELNGELNENPETFKEEDEMFVVPSEHETKMHKTDLKQKRNGEFTENSEIFNEQDEIFILPSEHETKMRKSDLVNKLIGELSENPEIFNEEEEMFVVPSEHETKMRTSDLMKKLNGELTENSEIFNEDEIFIVPSEHDTKMHKSDLKKKRNGEFTETPEIFNEEDEIFIVPSEHETKMHKSDLMKKRNGELTENSEIFNEEDEIFIVPSEHEAKMHKSDLKKKRNGELTENPEIFNEEEDDEIYIILSEHETKMHKSDPMKNRNGELTDNSEIFNEEEAEIFAILSEHETKMHKSDLMKKRNGELTENSEIFNEEDEIFIVPSEHETRKRKSDLKRKRKKKKEALPNKKAEVNNIKRRRTENHLPVEDPAVKCRCEPCGVQFYSEAALSRHIEALQGNTCDNTVRACAECGESFINEEMLKEHMKEHNLKAIQYDQVHMTQTEERPYKCSYCGVTFRKHAKRHMHLLLVHGSLRPYECHLCGDSYVTVRDLRCHMRHSHSNKTPRAPRRFYKNSKIKVYI